MAKRIKISLLYLGNMLLAALYPSVFLLCQNAEEVGWADIARFARLSIMGVTILFFVCLIILRKPAVASIASSILILFLLYYMYLQNGIQVLFPSAKYWHILPACIVVAGLLFSLFNRLCSTSAIREANFVLLMALLAMTCINVLPAVPVLAAKGNNEIKTEQHEVVAGSPNVYWMTFDECGSFEVIEEYYGFDTTKYKKALSNMGFTVSPYCNNTYTDTITVMTNCVMLEQIVDYDTAKIETEKMLHNSELLNQLSSLGYQAVGIGDTEWLGFKSITREDVTLAKTMGGDTAFDLLIEQSALAPLYRKPESEYAKDIVSVFSYLNNEQNIIPDQSMFYAVYVCSPHVPFIFDKNGMAVASKHYENWQEPQYYLGQYEYIMDQAMITLQTIIKNDPNAIIIFGSDHGPRGWPSIPTERRSENLMTVYAGQGDPIGGTSTIEILEAVLERIQGKDGV